jgi:RNA 2',3'-cyclic 3'-phosphodiesterase
VRGGIARWQDEALGDPALRPVRSEALHVTLCFLGYHPEKAIGRIAAIVQGIEARPVELRFEPGAAPRPKGRPRLYALGAESRAAIELQAELSGTLEAERFYEPEKRGFWPHVTVARVRSERLAPKPGQRRGKGRPKRVREPPGALPGSLLEPFGAVRVALYRSNLRPQGAEYVSLGGIDLPPPA